MQATPLFFRMNAKGSTEVDTLALRFDPAYPYGTRFVDISIGADPVGRFLARKFDVQVDTSLSVAVVTDDGGDATAAAVRRLGISARLIPAAGVVASALEGLQTVLIPEYVAGTMTAHGWEALGSFVDGGGRLVVLAQRTSDLADLPGSHGLRAIDTGIYDTTAVILPRVGDRVWTAPNELQNETWEGWLYRRATQSLVVDTLHAEVVAHVGEDKNPAVVRWSVGKGTIHYVNLNLGHQFLNVLPAAYQFLANLLAY